MYKRKYFGIYTLGFVAVVFLGYLPFWKNGKSLVWYFDGIGQYYPAFLYVGQYIRECLYNFLHANFVLPFFDLSIGMGEDIIGSLNYYGFGDPLNLLAVFATKENGAYVFTAIYFLKLYLSGICFRKYSSYMGLDGTLSCAGALCYVFSGYAVIGGARYTQFLTPMIYLPLILLGCEKIFREKKLLLMILSVAYAAVSTYYFLYMTSLFLIVYFVIRSLSIFGFKQIYMIFKNMFYCIVGYILGIMLAAPVLLPSVYAFLNSYRNTFNIYDILFNIDNYKFSKEYFMIFLRGFHAYFLDDYLSCIPVLQFICVFLSVFLYKTKRNRQCALSVIICSVLLCLPITKYVFSAFGSMYNRYVFLIYFVFAIVFICCAEELLKLIKFRKTFSQVIKYGIYITIMINIIFDLSLLYGENGEDWQHEFIQFGSVQNYVDSWIDNTEMVTNNIADYRISNDVLTDINGRPDNIAMLNNYNGLTFWYSVVNKNTQMMINQLGTIYNPDWRSYGLNDSSIYESMAGVRYYFQHDNNIQKAGYKQIGDITVFNEYWKIYNNTNALPLAYTYEESISDESYDNLSVIGKMDEILSYIAIENGNIEVQEDNNFNVMREADVLKKYDDNAIYISYDIDDNEEIYLELLQNNLYEQLKGFARTDYQEIYYMGSESRDIVYNLGTSFSNSRLDLSMDCGALSAEEAEEILSQIHIWTLDIVKYQELIDERRRIKEEAIHVLSDKIEIDGVVIDNNNWMLLAVPYSRNWKCYVDDKETQIYRANTMYMAVELENGIHQITFVYRNMSVYIGIWLSLTACVCFIVYCLVHNVKGVSS